MLLHTMRNTVPIAEQLAWPLDLEVLLCVLGCLVVVEPVRIFLPGEDLELEAGWGEGYVGAFGAGFISNYNQINRCSPTQSTRVNTIILIERKLT